MKHRTPTLRPLNALLKQALHSRALRRAALGLGAFAPALALANPTGGQVVAGNASINVPDSDHTVINQASQSAILNWQQFSIGSNQYVQFIQPDSSAVVLNRVIGGNPSQILGNMSANGQVFLVNPNGVFFGQGASLDVQGLIATTFDIKNSDFLAGHYVFAKGDGAPDAGVTNQGTLTANNGYIVLAGDYANNDGVIAAQAGQVVLASGNQMTLTLADNSLVSFVVDQATMSQYAGVSNTGSIEADGGVVLMTAKVANALTATAVNNSGLITAHSIQDHNGTIILAAQGGDIDVSGTLDASATQAGVTGGSVVIRGNGHTEIASTANILAEGDAAKGGFIELSGHTLKVRGQVNTGRSGELLIDPSILTIGAGTNFSSGTGGTPSTVTVGVGYIQNQLNSNKSVVLVASNSIGHSAGVTSLTATGNGNLSLKIGSVTAGSGSLKDPSSLGFGYGNGCQYAGVCSPGTSYKFSPNSNGTINLSGVTINIKGTFTASASFGTIKLGNVTAKAITLGGGGPSGYVYDISTQNLTATNGAVVIYGGNQADDHVTINGSVSAESSSGSVSGKSISITSGYIDVTGNLAATGTGSAIRIRGYGSSDNGGWIHIGGNVIATNGSVSITENGGASITVNGSIQALGKVSMSVNGNRNAPALIDVGGNINAGGAVNIVAHNSASATAGASINVASVTGKSITLTATASGSANITASTLHANGAATSDGVSVKASTSQASHNGGKINVNGGITVDHGGVTLNAKGGEDSGGKISVSGNISAAGNVSVTASNIGSCCGAIHLAKVTGAGITITLNESGSNASNISVGSLTALGPSYIAVYMNNGSASGTGKLIVNGSIKANNGGGVELTNIGGNSIDVTGGISAAGIVAVTQNNNVANTINIGGNIKGSHLQMTAYGSGSINIHVGNVVAGSNVTITGDNYGSGSANITVGNVSGTEVIIAANAASNQNAVIHTGALNAMNAVARGLVSVSASGKNTTITTGAISAQGVLTPFAGGDPSTENPFFRDAANVTLATTGTGNNAITVNGGITLKGAGGHFHYSGSYGNIYTASGSTGQAVLAIKNLNTGNTTVKVAGAINATGVGYAGVDISASKVTLGGAVNLTATAGKMKQSGTLSYSSPQNIVYSESGTKLGRAELLIHDDSGASLGGAVTIKGPSAQLIVEGDGGITTRGISLTASGEKFQHKATGIDSYSHTVNYSSTESAGTAAVLLLAGSGNIAKDVKVQGNITVTGIGKAVVGIEGNTITTQSLTVTQAAGKYSRTGKLPSGVFSSSGGGPNQLVLSSNDQSFGGMSDRDDLFGFKQGTLNGGIGGVRLQGVSSLSYCSCETPATSITVGGSITVSAVGQGDVTIAGKTVNITGGITGTATRATANGSGMHSSNSGAFNYSIKHTANGSGGRMLVDIRGSQASGQSSSSHYNGDNNYTGTATIGGAISLTGPTASVQIKSGTIKTGNISVDGTGENISVTDVYTPSEGNAFTLKRSGVIDWTGIELSGKAGTGKVTTGNLLAEGPLFVAIHISAGTVTVGNLGVIASSGNVTLLDTRISTTPLTFTAGDAGVAISTISSAGSTSVFGAATVNGNINVEATRDAHLLTNAAVSGYVLVTADGNIDDPLPANLLRFINHDPHSTGDSSSNAPTLNLSASALALLAGGNITLNDAVLKVGTGSVPGVVGDSTGIALLATQGLVSPGTPPNATFVAGGKLGLGKFTLTGDYLYMEASSYNLTGPISVPASTVVQFAPVSLPGSIGVEPGTSTSSQLNLSGTLLNLFPGTTFLIGGTGTTGDMTIGSQGKITLGGGSNFLVETAGNVTGLENILTTGLVGNLFELVNFQVPTASEIQNTSGTSDGNSDQKKKKTTNTGDNESGGGGGSVEQDDDTSGVCRG